jgi:flagellar motor switch protein FliM
MAQEFLSQDEVDALLKGVSGDEDEPPQASPPGEPGVRPYDIGNQERIVRGRMPTLEVVHDRFARLVRAAIFNFMRRSPEVSPGPVRVIKYAEFVKNLAVPTNLNLVALRPLRGSALFVLDPALVFTVVDNLFGGDSRFHTRIEGREFTPTESRIIQRLLAVVLEEYRRSWSPVHDISFEYVRSEMHTQFANIATPNEVVLVSTFSVEFGSGGGAMHVCIPYASVEPIRDKLFSAIATDQHEPDRRWMRMLSRQVQSAEVELVARLAEIELQVRNLVAMREGDVISFDLPRTLEAHVDGVPIFACRFGTLNGRYAVKVDRVLAASVQERASGDAHAP